MPTTAAETRAHAWLFRAAIGLTLLTALLALLAWSDRLAWQFGGLSTYQVFPIFGLLAFSIMWSQYVIAGIKQYLGWAPEVIKNYFDATGWLVLGAILLHPGLLIAQRYRDGYGLPPGSYESYVAPMQKWIVILGSLSLLMFLAFELKHFYADKRWWKYIVALNDIAILAIFYHGLQLGEDLGSSWYRAVWYFYGLILVPLLIYKYWLKWRARSRAS